MRKKRGLEMNGRERSFLCYGRVFEILVVEMVKGFIKEWRNLILLILVVLS